MYIQMAKENILMSKNVILYNLFYEDMRIYIIRSLYYDVYVNVCLDSPWRVII